MKTELRVGLFVIGAVLIFVYLSLNIDAFRMDHNNYDSYVAYFEDTSGLLKKADVKTSGVRIGWVDNIYLREGGKAEVHLKINKNYRLAMNAFAIIQQESLLGQRSIEIDQGDFAMGALEPGSTLAMPGKSSASVGDLIDQCRDIAHNVGDVAHAVRQAVASPHGKNRMNGTLDNIYHASETLSRELPILSNHIKNRAMPAIEDVGYAATSVGTTADRATVTFNHASKMIDNINKGKGFIGKLATEDKAYKDLTHTITQVKEYVDRLSRVQTHVDIASEYTFKTSKSKVYGNLFVWPSSTYFYQIQLTSSENGIIERTVTYNEWYDKNGKLLDTTDPSLSTRDKLEFAHRVERIHQRKNVFQFGFQFGKRFADCLTLRIGLFEGAGGFAAAYDTLFANKKLFFTTGVELFDFGGTKRIGASKPFIKWITTLGLPSNVLYLSLGLNDIAGDQGPLPQLGCGLHFNDEHMKYFSSLFAGLLSSISR